MNSTLLQISASWERAALPAHGGSALLMIRILAPGAPQSMHVHRSPVDLAFVIDRSGSMSGQPIELAKQTVDHAVGLLDDRDRATVVVYDDEVDLVSGLTNMDSRAREDLRSNVRRIESGGATNLCDGWLTGCQQLAYALQHESDHRRIHRTILLTDGLANQGETNPGIIWKHATELRRRGISTTTLGLGYQFDQILLSGMAEAGGGNFAYIESANQLSSTFEMELGRLTATMATRINLRLRLPEGLRGNLINPFPVERHQRTFDIAIDDLAATDEVVLIFEITSRNLLENTQMPFQLSLRWTDAITGSRQTVERAIEPLSIVDDRRYRSMEKDQEVSREAAIVQAAVQQRRAMELDQSGHFAASRELHRKAFDLLAAAPLAPDDVHLRADAQTLADYDPTSAFSEHDRKQTTGDTFRRTRRR